MLSLNQKNKRERTRGVCIDLTKKRSRKKDCGLRNMLVCTSKKKNTANAKRVFEARFCTSQTAIYTSYLTTISIILFRILCSAHLLAFFPTNTPFLSLSLSLFSTLSLLRILRDIEKLQVSIPCPNIL